MARRRQNGSGMKVAVAWNGPQSRYAHSQGRPNREGMDEVVVQKVAHALEGAGHYAFLVQGDMHLAAKLEGRLGSEDMVFNLCYGVQGASRYAHVPGLLEMAGYRYTGSGVLAHAVALEKPLTKNVLREAGLPTPDWYTVVLGDDPSGSSGRRLPDIPFPLVVKPCRESTSLGMSFVEDKEQLQDAVGHVHDEFRQPALVEAFAPGDDVMVPILGNRHMDALPAVQVRLGEGGPPLLTKEDKEGGGRSLDVQCPVPMRRRTAMRVRGMAAAAYRAIGCADWGRIDMRVAEDGKVRLLEVNSMPGLESRSTLPIAAEAQGYTFQDVILRILDGATHRYEHEPPATVDVRGDA